MLAKGAEQRFGAKGRVHFNVGGSQAVEDSLKLVRNAKGGKSLMTLNGHTAEVESVAFHPAGNQLASAGRDKSIRIWDIEKRDLVFKLEGTPGPVQSLAFHPRGRRLVSIGQDRMIRIWDLVTRQEILEFEEHVGTLRCVAFSADGRSLAAAGNGVVRVWQASRDMPDARR